MNDSLQSERSLLSDSVSILYEMITVALVSVRSSASHQRLIYALAFSDVVMDIEHARDGYVMITNCSFNENGQRP